MRSILPVLHLLRATVLIVIQVRGPWDPMIQLVLHLLRRQLRHGQSLRSSFRTTTRLPGQPRPNQRISMDDCMYRPTLATRRATARSQHGSGSRTSWRRSRPVRGLQTQLALQRIIQARCTCRTASHPPGRRDNGVLPDKSPG